MTEHEMRGGGLQRHIYGLATRLREVNRVEEFWGAAVARGWVRLKSQLKFVH